MLVLKGMGMGAADVIPGVSGGTIAFITGIYEELVHSIKNINFRTISTIWRQGLPAFWKEVNGNFLLAVVGGIMISVLTLGSRSVTGPGATTRPPGCTERCRGSLRMASASLNICW